MVNINIIMGLILFVLIAGLIVGTIILIIIKYKKKSFFKVLDKEIYSSENIDKYIDLYKEQSQSEIIREENQNARRRKLFRDSRGNPAKQLGDIKELIRGKSEVKRTTKFPDDKRGDERRDVLQNTTADENGETDWKY